MIYALTEQLEQTGLVGLLPLLPLTERGAKQKVVEEMITDVQSLADEESQANLLSDLLHRSLSRVSFLCLADLPTLVCDSIVIYWCLDPSL